jgi:cyanophycinase
MIKKLICCLCVFIFISAPAQENKTTAKGSLFIIGGGKRSPELMQTMLNTAQLGKQDYIVVLPMASAETDTAFYYAKNSLQKLCANSIVNFNFTEKEKQYKPWLDSLKGAKLIFIA